MSQYHLFPVVLYYCANAIFNMYWFFYSCTTHTPLPLVCLALGGWLV